MFNFKILIFPKNTPWGVVWKSDGTLQYKHVLRFETDELRDEFVNSQLFTESEQNYKTLLESEQERRFDFLSDTRVHFRFTPTASDQFNQIRSADFAVAKINNEYQFFALKVLKTLGKTIFFEGELDLFFSYKIAFRPQSQNFVARAHLNRLTPDGRNFKPTTAEGFPELYYAPEPFDFPLVKETTLPLSFSAAPKSVYWITFWATPSPGQDDSLILGQKTPYLIYFFPFSTKYISGTKNFKQCRVYNSSGGWTTTAPPSLYEALQSSPFIKKVIITPEPPLGFDGAWWTVNETANTVDFTRHGDDALADNYNITRISVGTPSGAVQAFVYELIRLDSSGGEKFKQSTTIAFTQQSPADLKEVKLMTPQFLRFFVKNFFDDKFEYGIAFLDNAQQIVINHLSTLALENPKSLFWIDETHRNNLLLGNLLEVNYLTHLPLNTDLTADYLLKNKNQIQTQLQQSRFNRNMTIANSVFKGLIGAAAVAAAPFTGGASLGAAAGVGIGASGASTVVGAASSALTAAKTHEFTKQRIDSQLADLAAQPKPIRVAGEQIYDVFTLHENVFFTQLGFLSNPVKAPQVLDFLNMFGYQLNKLFNLNSLLSNRKFWNFIQANDVFNSLNLRLSSPQKQIISNAFAEGLTFWHYRNAADWQGVLSFDRENWETNYAPAALKKSKKTKELKLVQISKKPPKNAKKSGLKIPDATRVL